MARRKPSFIRIVYYAYDGLPSWTKTFKRNPADDSDRYYLDLVSREDPRRYVSHVERID